LLLFTLRAYGITIVQGYRSYRRERDMDPTDIGIVNTFPGDDTDNVLSGTETNDAMLGLGGNDIILAGVGSDYLEGGLGNDILIGGDDDDRFAFGRSDGSDIVADFFPYTFDDPILIEREDSIVLLGGVPEDIPAVVASMTEVPSFGVSARYGDTTIMLLGITAVDLNGPTAEWFMLG
jgi:hypothetical protein